MKLIIKINLSGTEKERTLKTQIIFIHSNEPNTKEFNVTEVCVDQLGKVIQMLGHRMIEVCTDHIRLNCELENSKKGTKVSLTSDQLMGGSIRALIPREIIPAINKSFNYYVEEHKRIDIERGTMIFIKQFMAKYPSIWGQLDKFDIGSMCTINQLRNIGMNFRLFGLTEDLDLVLCKSMEEAQCRKDDMQTNPTTAFTSVSADSLDSVPDSPSAAPLSSGLTTTPNTLAVHMQKLNITPKNGGLKKTSFASSAPSPAGSIVELMHGMSLKAAGQKNKQRKNM